MSTRLELRGLSALQQALRQLPEELAADAQVIVDAHASQAQRDIVANYPEKSGTLKRRVKLERSPSRFGATSRVRSRAPHAHLVERGTGQRRTSSGANRGRMPASPESQRMIPRVVRIRARMVRALIDLVRRAGFEVSNT